MSIDMITLATPHGLDPAFDGQVEQLRSVFFQTECAKAEGEMSPEAEEQCRNALIDLQQAYGDFAVVAKVYSARGRLAGIPDLRRAVEIAREDISAEANPDRLVARRVLCDLAERQLGQRMAILNDSVLSAHASDLTKFRAAMANCARRIHSALAGKVCA